MSIRNVRSDEAYFLRRHVKQRKTRIPLTDRTVPGNLGVAANVDLPAVRINAPLASLTAQRRVVDGNLSLFVGGVLRAEIKPVGTFVLDAAGGTWNDTGDSTIRLTQNVPAAFPTSGDVYLWNGVGFETYAYTGVTGTDLTGVTPTLSQDFSGANARLGERTDIGSLAAGDLVNLRIVDGFAGVDDIRFYGIQGNEIARTKINASG